MERYFEFVLRRRVAVVVACLLLTAASLGAALQMQFASSIGKLFLNELPEYHSYNERMRAFGNDEVFLIAYEVDDPLSESNLARLREATTAVEARPDVERTVSLLDAISVARDSDGTVVIEPYDEVADRGLALARLRADPLYEGVLLARGGGSALAVVELTVDPYRNAQAGPELVLEVLDDFRRAGLDRVHRAGLPALVAELMAQTELNVRLLPVSGLFMLVVVWALFRRLGPALVAIGTGLVAVVWTLGFSSLLDRDFSVFTAIVPIVVLTVSFSDIVHMWSAYDKRIAKGQERRAAIISSAAEVGKACVLTSLTTFTGFVSLSAVPTPVSRQLGMVLGFGVGVSLLLAMTLVPIALSWLPAPQAGRTSLLTRAIDRVVDGSCALSVEHPWSILAGTLLFSALVGVGLARFGFETDFSARFSEANGFRQDQHFFEEGYVGTNTLDLFVDAPGGVLEPETFGRLVELQRELKALPQVDSVVSVVDPIQAVHRAMGGEGPLPPEAAGQYMLLLEMSGEEALKGLVDFERTTARIGLRMKDQGFRATGWLGQEATELGEQVMGDRATVEATGLTYLLGWYFNDILQGQKLGLFLSTGVIGLMMAWGLRNAWAGALSMVPNLLPVLAILAAAGFAWGQRTDSDTLIAAVMAVGIGVDDTIHFLVRYKLELARDRDVAGALRRSFDFAGRAIVMTTLILCAGFVPFAASDYFTIDMLGKLLPGALVVALVGDLLLVPAMARLGILRL